MQEHRHAIPQDHVVGRFQVDPSLDCEQFARRLKCDILGAPLASGPRTNPFGRVVDMGKTYCVYPLKFVQRCRGRGARRFCEFYFTRHQKIMFHRHCRQRVFPCCITLPCVGNVQSQIPCFQHPFVVHTQVDSISAAGQVGDALTVGSHIPLDAAKCRSFFACKTLTRWSMFFVVPKQVPACQQADVLVLPKRWDPMTQDSLIESLRQGVQSRIFCGAESC